VNVGQRQLLEAEYRNLLSCVRCGACLTSCPTYVLTGHEAEGPRGRVAMIRAALEDGLELTPDLLAHEDTCLVCDACSAVCPAGVHMEPLQVAFRAAVRNDRPMPPGEGHSRRVPTAALWLFGHMGAFRALAAALRFYQRSGLQWLARHLGVLRLLRLSEIEALLPAIAGSFLKPADQVSGKGTPVELFAGCVMSTALADVDRATIRVLERAGCEVRVTAGQGCCGALNAHAGDLSGAQTLARANIDAFEGETPVIVNSAGCGAMVKEYAHLLPHDPRAAAFAKRVVDVTEFLAGRELPFSLGSELTVAYQDACHLANAQGIRAQPRALLRAMPGLQLRELADNLCCGSAGVYNVTNPDVARQLQRRKVEAIVATGASVVATANPGCLLQLRAGLAEAGAKVQVKHIIELLDEATSPHSPAGRGQGQG